MKKVRLLQNGHGHISFQGGAFCDRKSVFAEGFQTQGYLKGFFPACCMRKNLSSSFEVLGQETQFSLDCLLGPCAWQRLQPISRGRLCISGAKMEAGHPRGKLGILDERYSPALFQSNPWILPCLSALEYFRKLSLQY